MQSFRIAEQSYQIAEATRKDSAAMRTVAIMTLAFLPGTFLCVSKPTSSFVRYGPDIRPLVVFLQHDLLQLGCSTRRAYKSKSVVLLCGCYTSDGCGSDSLAWIHKDDQECHSATARGFEDGQSDDCKGEGVMTSTMAERLRFASLRSC
jgi:hypothetical protein